MLLESCALETKYNEESTIKSSYRTSSDSGSMSINSQSNVIKQHQRQIIINSTEHLDNDFNSEHSFREERESYSSNNSLMSSTKFNISSELPPPLPVSKLIYLLLKFLSREILFLFRINIIFVDENQTLRPP
jgi:hypothetical protein